MLYLLALFQQLGAFAVRLFLGKELVEDVGKALEMRCIASCQRLGTLGLFVLAQDTVKVVIIGIFVEWVTLTDSLLGSYLFGLDLIVFTLWLGRGIFFLVLVLTLHLFRKAHALGLFDLKGNLTLFTFGDKVGVRQQRRRTVFLVKIVLFLVVDISQTLYALCDINVKTLFDGLYLGFLRLFLGSFLFLTLRPQLCVGFQLIGHILAVIVTAHYLIFYLLVLFDAFLFGKLILGNVMHRLGTAVAYLLGRGIILLQRDIYAAETDIVSGVSAVKYLRKTRILVILCGGIAAQNIVQSGFIGRFTV